MRLPSPARVAEFIKTFLGRELQVGPEQSLRDLVRTAEVASQSDAQ
ncbi:MAG TPA: hypothetical protein VGV88_00180 [Candidatus Dormibacteraeota bacterium]|nr:hypothetical protein [Candidatus Dormibacteraeota bacterium]